MVVSKICIGRYGARRDRAVCARGAKRVAGQSTGHAAVGVAEKKRMTSKPARVETTPVACS